MKKKTRAKSPGTYPLHRERQRRRILDAARKLFDERGIDRTTMAEIISASGLQPSTLYEYFSRKDEIIWAILSDLLEQDAANMKLAIEGATTGLSRITAVLEYMATQLADRRSDVRFMAQFDAMYARDWPAERLLTLEGQINNQAPDERGFKILRTWIVEGIADSSLRPDLDPDLTLHAVMNAVIGAQRRLASLGDKVELEYGPPIDQLFQETIRIIVFGLTAPKRSKATKPAPQFKTQKSTTRKRTS